MTRQEIRLLMRLACEALGIDPSSRRPMLLLSDRHRHGAVPTPVSRRWIALPYGVWTTGDGREVLFNRRYEPIWERYPVRRADHNEWVPWTRQGYFYDDGTPELEKCRVGVTKLVEWGVVIEPASVGGA